MEPYKQLSYKKRTLRKRTLKKNRFAIKAQTEEQQHENGISNENTEVDFASTSTSPTSASALKIDLSYYESNTNVDLDAASNSGGNKTADDSIKIETTSMYMLVDVQVFLDLLVQNVMQNCIVK